MRHVAMKNPRTDTSISLRDPEGRAETNHTAENTDTMPPTYTSVVLTRGRGVVALCRLGAARTDARLP